MAQNMRTRRDVAVALSPDDALTDFPAMVAWLAMLIVGGAGVAGRGGC